MVLDLSVWTIYRKQSYIFGFTDYMAPPTSYFNQNLQNTYS